jgi:diguanylate cyclase (GGDEF)-like protein
LLADSLKIKLVLIFIVMLITTLVIEAVNLTFFKLPELYALEAQSDKKDISRIKSAFNSIDNELAVLNYDNAVWNASYNYLNDRNDDFTQDNFTLDFFTSLNINGIHIYNKQFEAIWSKVYDSAHKKSLKFPSFENTSAVVRNSILEPSQYTHNNTHKPITHVGLIELNKQLIHFAATSINRASFNYKSNGTIVFWRFVDMRVISDLQKRAGIEFAFELIDLPNNEVPKNSKNTYIPGSYRTSEGDIYDYYYLINKNKVLKFNYKAPQRQFDTHWFQQTFMIAIFFSATFSIIFLLIHYLIIKPIIEAKKLVIVIIDDSDLSVRFSHKRKDELGTLFNLINRLLEDISSKEQELISHNLRLQEISKTDGLTNIANRRAFDLYMNQLISTSAQGLVTSILVCDVDYFKKYNDFYGHALGDKTLRLIAENFKRNLHSETDFVARYGGEEFVIVLKNTNEIQAQAVAKNLITSTKELNIAHQKSEISDTVTISIGCHTFIASEQQECTSLFEKADKALYLAKSLGRDRACSSSLLSQF